MIKKKVKQQAKPSSRVLDKVKKIYANYGIDVELMDDDELLRVAKYYSESKNELESDLSESSNLSEKFSEEDLI
jgi:hypothetical protein